MVDSCKEYLVVRSAFTFFSGHDFMFGLMTGSVCIIFYDVQPTCFSLEYTMQVITCEITKCFIATEVFSVDTK